MCYLNYLATFTYIILTLFAGRIWKNPRTGLKTDRQSHNEDEATARVEKSKASFEPLRHNFEAEEG